MITNDEIDVQSFSNIPVFPPTSFLTERPGHIKLIFNISNKNNAKKLKTFNLSLFMLDFNIINRFCVDRPTSDLLCQYQADFLRQCLNGLDFRSLSFGGYIIEDDLNAMSWALRALRPTSSTPPRYNPTAM
jgi:hypothetical protein